MKQFFLTSCADQVLADLIKYLPFPPQGTSVAFIDTAAEVESGDHWWVTADRNALTQFGFVVDQFSLTGLAIEQIEIKIKDKKIIFVAGGNTFFLLDQMIKTGFDQILKRKLSEGIIYIGSSAGSMVIGQGIDVASTIDERSKAPGLKSNGLGIIDLAILPHWGGPDFKEEYYQGFESMYNENYKLIPLNNQQYLIIDGQNYQIIQT